MASGIKFLLDTNVCIAFLHRNDPAVRVKLAEIPSHEIALCSVVKAELLYGARKSQWVHKNLQILAGFFSHFESFTFDDRAAEHYGLIHATLRAAGHPIGLNDILIASIALARDVTVVTRNTREFIRVPGLRLELW